MIDKTKKCDIISSCPCDISNRKKAPIFITAYRIFNSLGDLFGLPSRVILHKLFVYLFVDEGKKIHRSAVRSLDRYVADYEQIKFYFSKMNKNGRFEKPKLFTISNIKK